MNDQIEIRAFGQRLTLTAPQDAQLREDCLWRIRTHYSPAMSARSLAPSGLALDIGAGFGSFALPFALAYPGWTLIAFEPEPRCFAALTANIAALGLTNVVAVQAAIGPGRVAPPDPDAVSRMLFGLMTGAARPEALPPLLNRAPFSCAVDTTSHLKPGPAPDEGFRTLRLPSLPAEFLPALGPQLVKLTAPLMERAIFTALRDVPIDHFIGESWGEVDRALVIGAQRPGRRETWVPKVGPGLLALRHAPLPGQRRIGLDVAVALYNQRDYVLPCLESLLSHPCPELRVLVVDDGSTDGSGDLVRQHFGTHPQVRLFTKPNGGCASARNHGRQMSDASHIAFVDADDLPNPHLFPSLLELATQTGAEIVQGGFHLFDGDETFPSRESQAPILAEAFRHRIGPHSCCLLPSAFLLTGQPSIWRRVYRRDFLDTRRIWFPEHVRAFDDQIFQILTLQSVVNVPMLDGVTYGYRQHPGQDTRQMDERHFYSLEMFRLALRRGLEEGWAEFRPVFRSFINTVNWVCEGLRPDLVPAFCRGAAEFWVLATKVLREEDLPPVTEFHRPEILALIEEGRARLRDLPRSSAYVFLDNPTWQVPMVRHPWEGTGRA